ncbi:hypothetical protein B5M09_002337 [Aphanomyces astaci]|nr:hypothetical protein B5M09_002337 [Aphanomyces astaci]
MATEGGGNGHDMADMMKLYTEGMQAQFGAMMGKFRASMEQSVGMSRMMNDMMEHLLLQSLDVKCVVTGDGAAATTLHLDVRNTGAIPIPVVCCTVSIRRRFPASPADDTDDTDDTLLVVKTTPADLDVGSHTSTVLPLDLPSLDQYNGQVVVSCVSPGSGQRLQKSNDFSVYLLQQLAIRPLLQPVDVEASSVTSVAPLDLHGLRQALQICPTDGIVLASHGHYTIQSSAATSPSFVLAVSQIDATTCHVHVTSITATESQPWTAHDIVFEVEALARVT